VAAPTKKRYWFVMDRRYSTPRLMSTAASTGPSSVPGPPRIVHTMTSIESSTRRRSTETNPWASAYRMPLTAAMAPATTLTRTL
jgi:hypothetical protein